MRIRTVKPEFWTHPLWARQPDDVRLLALALLNCADDSGYFYAAPELVHAVMPFWLEAKLAAALDALARLGWIECRQHPEYGRLGRVTNFTKHQKIDRPAASRVAPLWESLDEDSSRQRRGLGEDSAPDQGIEGSREQVLVTCAEPAAAVSVRQVPPISFDFDAGTWRGIDDARDVQPWIAAYPAVDVRTELLRAGEWLKANPRNRKKNCRRFLVGWFTRAQDRARTSPCAVPPGPSMVERAHATIEGAAR